MTDTSTVTELATAVLANVLTSTTVLRPDVDMKKHALNGSRSINIVDCGSSMPNHRCAIWSGEERFIPPGHPAEKFVQQFNSTGNDELISCLKENPTVVFGVPILEVDDAEGTQLRNVKIDSRIFHRDCPTEVLSRMVVSVPALSVIRHVRASVELAMGNYAAATSYAVPARGALERRVFLEARKALESEEALVAFDVLFKHCSLNEELDRLSVIMDNLPFTLDEHPKMDDYRLLLAKQIGHLEGKAAKWYETGNPSSHLTEMFVSNAYRFPGLIPERLKWLMDECRAKGYTRVAEYGASDGSSLFYLIQNAPDIEWHGYEISPSIVEEGIDLARRTGLDSKFHLHVMDAAELDRGTFDAVALFEVLEHNTESEGAELLRRAEVMVRDGGTVFITTPCGNWSAFHDQTRVLDLRKDHIRAYTVKRMTEFLSRHGRVTDGTLKVVKVENPTVHEANAWVFAQYRVKP